MKQVYYQIFIQNKNISFSLRGQYNHHPYWQIQQNPKYIIYLHAINTLLYYIHVWLYI